jgi:hypothetical protein
MATQATEQIATRTVPVTVDTVGTVNNGKTQFKFVVPEISKFPLPMSVPSEDAEQLKPGQTYNVVLAKGRLKEGKTGQFDNEYWWDWQGFADPDAAPTPQAPATAPQSAVQPVSRVDPTRDSIERQTALIQATLLASNGMLIPSEDSTIAGTVMEHAEMFYDWLQHRPVPPLVQAAVDAGGVLSPDDLPFDLDGGPPDA